MNEATRDTTRDAALRNRCRHLIAAYPQDPKLVIRRSEALAAGLKALIRCAVRDAHDEPTLVEINARLALAALEAVP